jgi:hypothetical protein
VKVGMVLTAHKTVTMFMRYVHTEDDPVRAAAEAVAQRRQALVSGVVAAPAVMSQPNPAPPSVAPESSSAVARVSDRTPLGLQDGAYTSQTKLGNYRPFRHRGGENRAVPLGTKRAPKTKEAAHAR